MQADIVKFKRHWPGGEGTDYARRLRPSIIGIEHAIQKIINEEDEYVLILQYVRADFSHINDRSLFVA